MNNYIIDEKRKEIENSILSEELILSMPDNEYKGFEWLIDILGSTKLCEANNQTIKIKYSSSIIILDVGRSIRNRMLGDSHLECKIDCLDSKQEAKSVCIRSTGTGTATDACATFVLWAENKFDDFTTPKDIKQVILDVIYSFLDVDQEFTTIVNSKTLIMQEKRRQYFSKERKEDIEPEPMEDELGNLSWREIMALHKPPQNSEQVINNLKNDKNDLIEKILSEYSFD